MSNTIFISFRRRTAGGDGSAEQTADVDPGEMQAEISSEAHCKETTGQDDVVYLSQALLVALDFALVERTGLGARGSSIK